MLSKLYLPGLTPRLAMILLSVSLGPFLFGFHLAELNSPQDVITCKQRSDAGFDDQPTSPGSVLPRCIPMTAAQFGVVSAIFTLGGLVGSLLAAPCALKYGRVRMMLAGSFSVIAGGFLEAIASSISALAIGRVLSGIAAGIAIVVSPVYISDIAPPSAQGQYGAVTQVMVNFGIFAAQLLGLALSNDQHWRLILIAPCAVGAFNVVLLATTPESPSWQLSRRRASPLEIKALMSRIWSSDIDVDAAIQNWKNQDDSPDGEDARLLQSDGSVSVRPANDDKRVGMISILRDQSSLPGLKAIMIVCVAQQMCGINSIIMYGVSLLATVLSSSSATLNLLVSVFNIVVTIASAQLPDRFGRKVAVLASIAGMGVSSVLLAVSIIGSAKILSCFAVVLFVASFAIGLGPVPFTLASALMRPEAVDAAQSWSQTTNLVATFVVAQFFPILNDKLPSGQVYFVFAAMAAISFGLIYRDVPVSISSRPP